MPAKVTKLIGLKRPPFLSPTNLIIFACTQNGEYLNICMSIYKIDNLFATWYYNFSAKASCSIKIKSPPSKRVAGGSLVQGRIYPWAAAYFNNDEFGCGGNLGKNYNKSLTLIMALYIFSNSKTCFVCGPLSARQKAAVDEESFRIILSI